MSENKMNVMDLPDGGSLQKGDTVLVIRDNGDGTQTAVRTDAGTATSGIVDSEGNLTVKGFLSVKGDTSLRGNVVVSDTESSRGSVSTEKLYANTIDAYDDALYINNVESINSTGNQEFRLPPTSGTLTTSEATDTKLATKIDKGSLATINGSTLENGGNITLDLSLFKLVTALPTTDIDETKIYLVKSAETTTGNLYTEYIYADGAWEKLGEYKSDVDLSDYAKTADINPYLLKNLAASVNATGATLSAVNVNGTTYSSVSLAGATASQAGLMLPAEYSYIKNISEGLYNKGLEGTLYIDAQAEYVSIDCDEYILDKDGKVDKGDNSAIIEAATTTTAGVMSAVDKTKLDGITTGATADSAISADEINALS